MNAAAGLLLLLLAADLPHGPPDRLDQVDRIELNHLICPETGEPRLTQVIYWRWRYDLEQHHVTAWRLVDRRQPFRILRDAVGPYERRVDQDGTLRIIRARVYCETTTVNDPEVDDRQLLPQDQRTGLKRPREQRCTP